MPAAARALLFALCALAAPALLQATDQCSMEHATAATKFTLTVEPTHYLENTNYTVTVKGVSDTDTFTALLFQALDTTKKTSSGEWMMAHETYHCPEKTLLYNGTSHKSFVANWTSPSSPAESVEIRAFVTETDGLKLIAKNVTKEHPTEVGTTTHTAKEDTHATKPTPATTKAPSKTEATSTTKKPTHSGSEREAYSSYILIAIVQSVYLLFIGGRL